MSTALAKVAATDVTTEQLSRRISRKKYIYLFATLVFDGEGASLCYFQQFMLVIHKLLLNNKNE